MPRLPGFRDFVSFEGSVLMKPILPLFTIAYAAVALLFAAAALVLVGFAFRELWDAVAPREGQALAVRAATAIESIGLLAVARRIRDGANRCRRGGGASGPRQCPYPRAALSLSISRGGRNRFSD